MQLQQGARQPCQVHSLVAFLHSCSKLMKFGDVFARSPTKSQKLFFKFSHRRRLKSDLPMAKPLLRRRVLGNRKSTSRPIRRPETRAYKKTYFFRFHHPITNSLAPRCESFCKRRTMNSKPAIKKCAITTNRARTNKKTNVP